MANHRNSQKSELSGWRLRMHEIIYEADTPEGRLFDLVLIGCILASVACVILESVASVAERHAPILHALEIAFTGLFTVEYVLRLICVSRPSRYALSFFGIVDLLAVLPGYLSLLLPGVHFLLVIRILRLLRMFRILKLARYLRESEMLMRALSASRTKILVFLFTVLNLVVLIGAIMYVVEGEANGFTSIPVSMYWAVVTLTTVGYGDISPKTPLGQALSMVVMILGYAIIAVPTGIVTAEMTRGVPLEPVSTQACPACSREGHAPDARHCKYCGARL